MIGAIIWRSSNANRGHYAMVRRLQRCPTSSVNYKITCCAKKAEIASLSVMQASPAGQWMVDILSLVLHHDESAVLRAVELALEAGVPTKTHILNLLHRLIDPKRTDQPEIDPPDALALETAPMANVDRYDDLRQAGGKRNAS